MSDRNNAFFIIKLAMAFPALFLCAGTLTAQGRQELNLDCRISTVIGWASSDSFEEVQSMRELIWSVGPPPNEGLWTEPRLRDNVAMVIREGGSEGNFIGFCQLGTNRLNCWTLSEVRHLLQGAAPQGTPFATIARIPFGKDHRNSNKLAVYLHDVDPLVRAGTLGIIGETYRTFGVGICVVIE